MKYFKNSVIDQAFFKLALEGTISLEEARKILESYNGNTLDLLFLLNELIDSKESGRAPIERPVNKHRTKVAKILEC